LCPIARRQLANQKALTMTPNSVSESTDNRNKISVDTTRKQTRPCSQREYLEALYSPACPLSTTDRAVVFPIASRVNCTTGRNAIFPREALATAANLKNVNSVTNVLARVKRMGFLSIERRKRTSPSGVVTWCNVFHLKLPIDFEIPKRSSPGQVEFQDDNGGAEDHMSGCPKASTTSLSDEIVSRFLPDTSTF